MCGYVMQYNLLEVVLKFLLADNQVSSLWILVSVVLSVQQDLQS